MNISLGGCLLRNVNIPLLWGSRAILQDTKGRVSVIDLSGPEARLEILWDKPAEGLTYRPTTDGLEVLDSLGHSLYHYDREAKSLRGTRLPLPECTILENEIQAGSHRLSHISTNGSAVGIKVLETGAVVVGSELPEGLARLVV